VAQKKYPYNFTEQIDEIYSKNPQKAALEYSFIGEYKKAIATYGVDEQPLFNSKEIESIKEKYKAHDAVNYLIKKSKEHQLMIINEAHHRPRHRLFVHSLLESLCNQGYNYLALETLCHYKGNACDSDLQSRGFPLNHYKTGIFTREPQFGNLVRDAIEMGYTIVSYESTNHSDSNEREENQAKALAEVFAKDPSAKMLVLCGYDHLIEKKVDPEKNGGKEMWMAGYLKKMTGINPLTINQIPLTENIPNKMFFDAFDIKKSSVFINKKDENDILNNGKADILLAHPAVGSISERPAWMNLSGYSFFLINDQLTDLVMTPPLLVKAYKSVELGDDISPVPVDIIQIQNKEERKALFLPINEKITLRISNIEGIEKDVEVFTKK